MRRSSSVIARMSETVKGGLHLGCEAGTLVAESLSEDLSVMKSG